MKRSRIPGQKEQGLKDLNKAVIYAPDEPIFWANLGGAYGMIGDYKNSIYVLRKGLDVSPESGQLSTNLALSYINMKDYKEAVSILESLSNKERKENNEVVRLLKLARKGLQGQADGSAITSE